MKGADEYCEIFKKAEQVGRLYILPSSHARGATFRLYVLPKDEKVIENHGINPPLNTGAVEVYGQVSGNLGWTETYGWLHKGEWCNDLLTLFDKRLEEKVKASNNSLQVKNENQLDEVLRVNKLLDDY